MTTSKLNQVIVILGFILLALPLGGLAQQTRLDSLKNLLSTHNDQDTLKVKALYEIGNYFMYEDRSGFGTDSAFQYLEKALQLSKAIPFKRGLIISYNYLGRAHNYKRLRHLSLEYFLKALLELKGTAWPQMAADINLEMGHIYYAMHYESKSPLMYAKAITHFKLVIAVCQNARNFENKAGYNALALRRISECHTDAKNYDSAIYYQNLALKESEGMPELQQDFWLNLVTIYRYKKDYAKALEVSHSMINKFYSSPDSSLNVVNGKCNLYQTMAAIYLDKKNPDSTFYYLSKMKRLYERFGLPRNVDYLTLLCNYYFQTGKYTKVIQLADTMINIMNFPSQGQHGKLFYYHIAAEANAKLGKFKTAYDLLNKSNILIDSLTDKHLEANLIKQQADYESLLKTQEISLLQDKEKSNQLTISQQEKIQLLFVALLLVAVVAVIIFISRYRLSQRAKQEQEKLFQETDQLKSRFFANISHEFRTPLTLILGPLADRISSTSNEEDKSNLSIAYKNAKKLLSLVNQLLDLSKLESKNLKLKASYQNLVPLLKQLASQFSSIASSREIDFKMNHPEEVMLWLDSDKIGKIVSNLLANAFKFTPVGGNIFVEVRLENSDGKFQNGSVEIDISDSGIGIAPDKTGKIFDRFYQVNDSSKREYEGTGIGLALVKELVELHYGQITVFSEPGQGTTFYLKLPLGKDHFKNDEMIDSHLSIDWNGKPLIDSFEVQDVSGEMSELSEKPFILIVEDNADLREYLTNHLNNAYNVSTVKNGKLGVEQTTSKLPDIVISDLMMPEMDGLELCNTLKTDERTSHIPIILLTAKADMQSKIEGLHLGADDYIAKPFEMPELEARIQNLIQNRKKLRSAFSKNLEIRPSEIKAESMDDRFLKKTLMAIEDHIADEKFSVEALALEVGMSNVQLYRKLKALTGKTPNEVIRNLRLDRANFLLTEKAGNVSEVAYLTGFRNTSYFAKCFKERFGISPSEIKGQS